MPIGLLFYIENDLSSADYITLHAIYSGVIAFFEVPSGYIADIWGRKPSLVLGTLFGILGFATYSAGSGKMIFICAEILLGVGQSLISGADTALLYDTLVEHKTENKYLNHEGKITSAGNFAEVAAALFVSLFVLSSYRKWFYLQTIVAAIAFIASIFLSEPKYHKRKSQGRFDAFVNTLKYVVSHSRLRNIIIMSSVIGFASLSMAWFAQPILKEIGINERLYGFSWIVLNSMVAFGSLYSIRLDSRNRFAITLLIIGLPLSLGFFVTSFVINYWVALPLVVFYFIRGTAHPVLKKYINDYTTSDIRATVLSIRSLIIRLLFFIMGPIFGFLTGKVSLEIALILCGTVVFIPFIIYYFILVMHKNCDRFGKGKSEQ